MRYNLIEFETLTLLRVTIVYVTFFISLSAISFILTLGWYSKQKKERA